MGPGRKEGSTAKAFSGQGKGSRSWVRPRAAQREHDRAAVTHRGILPHACSQPGREVGSSVYRDTRRAQTTELSYEHGLQALSLPVNCLQVTRRPALKAGPSTQPPVQLGCFLPSQHGFNGRPKRSQQLGSDSMAPRDPKPRRTGSNRCTHTH